jgi:hypothetical protein
VPDVVKDIPVRERSASNDMTTSWNKEKLTVDVVFATDTPTLIYEDGQPAFYEVLGFEPGMMMQNRTAVMPVRDNHDGHLGRVVPDSFDVKPNHATATMKIWSGATDTISKLDENILAGVSARFRVHEYKHVGVKNGLPILKATSWEPMEISFADVPEDGNSRLRTANKETNKVIIKNSPNMTEQEIAAEAAKNADRERAATDASNKAIVAERARAATIRSSRATYDLPEDFVEKHINEGTTVEVYNGAVLDHLRTAKELDKLAGGQPKIDGQAPDARVTDKGVRERARAAAQSDAILSRMNKKEFKLTERNEYAEWTLVDHARSFLREVGQPTSDDKGRDIQLALRVSEERQRAAGGMTRADFGSVYLNVLDKNLLKQVEFFTGGYEPLTYNQDAAMIGVNSPSIKIGEFGAFQPVQEDGEYPLMTNKDSRENFMAIKRGGRMGISFEMMANDDLGAINQFMTMFAQSQAFTEDDIVWPILSNGTGPNMLDGNPLFDATNHKNYNATPTALAIGSLNAMYLGMRNQTYFTTRKMLLDPQYLVVGTANEYTARQLTSQNYTPTSTATVVPDFLKGLKVIVSPTLGLDYVLGANPTRVSLIRTGGVTGQARISFEEKLI